MEADGEDFDAAAAYYTFNEGNDTAPGTQGHVTYYTGITFTDGADMDSVAAGDLFILRVRRESSDTGNDTMSNDAHLWVVEVKET
jgi:hypothetical protein